MSRDRSNRRLLREKILESRKRKAQMKEVELDSEFDDRACEVTDVDREQCLINAGICPDCGVPLGKMTRTRVRWEITKK